MSAHNPALPVDLRTHPHCYLCGGRWKLILTMSDEHGTGLVECKRCELRTYVQADAQVWEARGWTR
jgi:transcription elongation factor Elf1